jgi:tRNA(Ile)-lysidine synthase
VAQTLAERVLGYVRRFDLLRPGDRVGVAVSGGADSVALLHLLHGLRAELGLVLSVVHFNHKIRGAEADADQEFVGALAERFGLAFHAGSGDAPAQARAAGLSLETAGRELRYGYFRQLCAAAAAAKIATAHTLDDQAETVLLRLLRGAGTRGLAGIYPRAFFSEAVVVRPLLEIRRSEVEEYLRSRGQPWREDATNRDVQHARNRVRHVLLPLLEREFNPAIRQVLAETAEIARGEEDYWRTTLEALPIDVVHPAKPGTSAAVHLRIDKLAELPVAVQRRLVRQAVAAAAPGFQHVEQVLGLIHASGAAETELRRPWRARRLPRCPLGGGKGDGAEVVVEENRVRGAKDYEYALPVPGEVCIREIGAGLRVLLMDRRLAEAHGFQGADLGSPPALGAELRVRNWRAGGRFWPVHTKVPKKIKELLQARHVSGYERALWPVAVNSAGESVWLRGFGFAQPCAAPQDQERVAVIQEVSLERESQGGEENA